MPYTKSIVVGLIIFILIVPVIGSLPYKGADNASSFKLIIPKFPQPYTVSDYLTDDYPKDTYGDAIIYAKVSESNVTRDAFYGFGGFNGTIRNIGDVNVYVGITPLEEFNSRYTQYSHEAYAGNIAPLNALKSLSKRSLVEAGKDIEISHVYSTPLNACVVRLLPDPNQSGEASINYEINLRNYITVERYLTTIVFMADTNLKNFTMQITSAAQGSFYLYIGIVPVLKYNERKTAYGGIQYRQIDKAKEAYSALGLSYSARSKMMTRTAFASLAELTKGYYIIRVVAFYQANIKLNVNMSSTRPSVPLYIRLRIITLVAIALYQPIKTKRGIEYLLKK